jgi:hypothetical protein
MPLLILSSLLPVFVLAQDDPMTLTATHSRIIRPDRLGMPGNDWTECDLMIYGPKNPNPDFRSVVEFDLKDVPKQPCTAAVLRLTFYKLSMVRNKSTKDIMRVHRILRPWTEKTVSWSTSVGDDEWINKGGDFDPNPVAATPIIESMTGDPSDKTIEFDVTALVQGWQTSQYPNFGVMLAITDNDSSTNARPYSHAEANNDKRPKLILYWNAQPKKDGSWLKPSTLKPLGNPIQMKIAFNPSLKQCRLNEKYEDHLKAKGGAAPYSYKVKGNLPDGLSITPEGAITGTPTKAGKFPLTVTITDAAKLTGTFPTTMEVIVGDNGPAAKKPDEKPDPNKPAEGEKPKPKKDNDQD